MKTTSIKRNKLLLVLCFLLAGCSNVPVNQVNDRLQSWKASSIEDVVKYWGVPTKQQQINGKSYAEWLSKETTKGNTAVSVGTGSFSRHSSIGLGLTLFDLGGSDNVCSRTVTYDNSGQITDIRWTGDKNYCYEITPDRAEILANKANMKNN